MIERLQNRRNYLASLIATANLYRRELKELRKDLEIELTQLRMMEDLFEKVKRDFEIEQEYVDVLQESIARLRAHPEINRIDQAKSPKLDKVPRNRGAISLSIPVVEFMSSGTNRSHQFLVHHSILDHQIGNEIDSSSSDEEEISFDLKRTTHDRDDDDNKNLDNIEFGNQKYDIGDVIKENLEIEDENDRPPRTFTPLNAKSSET